MPNKKSEVRKRAIPKERKPVKLPEAYDGFRKRKRQQKKLKPRTDGVANVGLLYAESRRELGKKRASGFKLVTTKKEESEDEIEDDERSNRNFSTFQRERLEELFEQFQYLDKTSKKGIAKMVNLTETCVRNWFVNRRRKANAEFKNGKLPVLPWQMIQMRRTTEQREEQGENHEMVAVNPEVEGGDENEEDLDGAENQQQEQEVFHGGVLNEGVGENGQKYKPFPTRIYWGDDSSEDEFSEHEDQ